MNRVLVSSLVTSALALAFAAPVMGQNLLSNPSFEDWDDAATVSHPGGAFDGQSASNWNAGAGGVWSTFKTYPATVDSPVSWLRMEERNQQPGPTPAALVNPAHAENTSTYVNNNYLPAEGMAGWDVFGNIDVKSSYWETVDTSTGFDTAANDKLSLDLSCTRGGGVQQTFQVTPGQTYTVEFDMSVNMYKGSAPRPMLVQVGLGDKSVYQQTNGQSMTYGDFQALALQSYSNVQVFDHDTNVDADVNVWNPLSAESGSEGTRVAYSTVDLSDADAFNPGGTTNINDGWGNAQPLGQSLLARDVNDATFPTANDGLEGLVFWFDWDGSAGSGQPAIPGYPTGGERADWTRVAFQFYADPDLLEIEEGFYADQMTISFMSLEGDLEEASNHGPALDDVVLTPEPATMILLTGGALGLLARRKR